MKPLRLNCFIVALLLSFRSASAQGFVNLGFENTTITTVHYPGGDRYTATVPGWGVFGFPYGNPTDIGYNEVALDAPMVTLQGTSSPYFPAVQGSYSVLLQGGTTAGGLVYNTNGASVFQTGQIPVTSQSLIYLGSAAVRVAFNGQPLSSIAISNAASYTVWGIDVSSYAGQSGELRFTAPWRSTPFLSGAILDGIQFSPMTIPEPSALALAGIVALCLFGTTKRSEQIRSR